MDLEETSFELENVTSEMKTEEPNPEGKQPLIFGIVSIFFGAIIFGVLAITLSNRCKDDNYSKAGRLLGIVGIVLWGYSILIEAISQIPLS